MSRTPRTHGLTMWREGWCGLVLVLLVTGHVTAAPFPAEDHVFGREGGENHAAVKTDLTVEQLEKLKTADSDERKKSDQEGHTSIQLEAHRLDASVQQNGELVSRVSHQGSATSLDGQPPRVHAVTELEVPTEGVHKVVVQDGSKVTVQEPVHQETPKEKVFRGAARLVQPSSVAGDTPPVSSATSNGNRRAFNADIGRENNYNMDHYSAYTGVQYSPLDMAEYVFWTGDERGVTAAIEDFLQQGLMSKDEAIRFLQEIKYNMEYLKAHYSLQSPSSEDEILQGASRSLGQATVNPHNLPYSPFSNSADIARSITTKNYELNKNLLSSLPALSVSREAVKRTLNDPMLSTNIINTSDYDRESGPLVTEEEYEEMVERLRAADALYTQHTLEEIIYQLSKMMFAQTLSREPSPETRQSLQRFMNFLQLESERGYLSRNNEKKVLDVMVSALSDTVAEHPELLLHHDRFIHQPADSRVPEHPLSRAFLAAYKDELARAKGAGAM